MKSRKILVHEAYKTSTKGNYRFERKGKNFRTLY